MFGGYVAEDWTFTDQLGCTSGRAINSTDVFDANWNNQYLDGTAYPTGTALYYFMGGPGADPSYNASNPSASEAYNWGVNQGYDVWWIWDHYGPTVKDPVVFMDIENPGNGTYEGWDEEVNSCGYRTGTTPIPSSIDRQTFNGFWNEIYNNTGFWPGVYSSPSYWNYTFGTGSYGSIPNTYQWTSESDSGSPTPGPYGWCQSGYGCASWFGGVSGSYQAAWQFAVASSGDWDQFDSSNLPAH